MERWRKLSVTALRIMRTYRIRRSLSLSCVSIRLEGLLPNDCKQRDPESCPRAIWANGGWIDLETPPEMLTVGNDSDSAVKSRTDGLGGRGTVDPPSRQMPST